MRADVNVSVRRPGEPLGTRCEIKNVNSIRFIGQAIEHEARRQIDILEDGGTIEQETRLFDAARGETRSMRTQGRGARLPLFPRSRPVAAGTDGGGGGSAESATCRNCRTRRRRASSRDFALSAYDAGVLVAERETADYFESVAKGRDAKAAANWVINELFGRLNKQGNDIAASPVSAAQLGGMLDLIADGTISGKIAKDLFEILWSEGGDPKAIVEARGMKQVTDLSAPSRRWWTRSSPKIPTRSPTPRPIRRRSAGSSAR